MKKEPVLLATWIMCSDGTMLPSFHNHDYRTHTTVDSVALEHPEEVEEPEKRYSDEWWKWNDECETVVKESRWSMVDGGPHPYGRRGGVYTEMSVYSDDPYEVIRRFVCRGGRGKDSKEHLTWTPLCRINNPWLEALIEYEGNRNPSSKMLKYYKKELKYRKKRNIFIPEPNDGNDPS